jgi:periplasmic protein TonB
MRCANALPETPDAKDRLLGTSGTQDVQQRIDSIATQPEPAANAVAAAVARLGTVKPAKVEPPPATDGAGPAEPVGKFVIPVLTPAQRRRRTAFRIAAVLSLLLHAGSLAAFLTWHAAHTGAIEQPSDAISVEIVESRTLEALQPKQVAEPAPVPEATAPTEGKAEASETAAAKSDPAPEPEPEPRVIVPPPPPDIPEAPEDASRAAKEAAPEKSETPPIPVEGPAVVIPPPPKAATAEENAAAKRPQAREIEKKARERAPKGGVTSKSSAGKGTGGESASASSGSLLSYAAHVRARVAANKPPGGGLRGTATVSFGVTTSGGLAYASVARSSGSAALDQLAVAAVRGSAPFPTPPAGATAAQLQFTIPFYFE